VRTGLELTLNERTADEFVIQPLPIGSARPTWATMGWLLASAGFALRFRGATLIFAGALDAAFVLLVVAFVAVVRPRVMLRVANDELVFSRLRGDRVVIGPGEGGQVVEFDVALGRGPTAWRSHFWTILREDGSLALKLNRLAWDRDALEMVRTHFCLPSTAIEAPLTAAAAQESYPGLLSWPARHPNLTSILTVAGILAVALVARS
jgi:hypothetical protein